MSSNSLKAVLVAEGKRWLSVLDTHPRRVGPNGNTGGWQTCRRLPTIEIHGRQCTILGPFWPWLLTILWKQRKRGKQWRLSLLSRASDRAVELRKRLGSGSESQSSRAGAKSHVLPTHAVGLSVLDGRNQPRVATDCKAWKSKPSSLKHTAAGQRHTPLKWNFQVAPVGLW